MAFDLAGAERAANVILNGSVAIAAGCALSRDWIGSASCAWALARREKLARWSACAVVLALLAGLASLWLKAADMADVPPAQAFAAIRTVLTDSHYGLAWVIGQASLVAAGAWLWTTRAKSGATSGRAAFVPLAVFWYAQCMSSHGAENGDFTAFMLVYSAHLALISLWLGEVLVAGMVVLPNRGAAAPQWQVRLAYIGRLSDSAIRSLAGILLTGTWLAWKILRGVSDLVDDTYGRILLLKLALVAIAVCMGGYNRFFVMPSLGASGSSADDAAVRFGRVLRIEAVVLLGALVLAAILGSTPPPGTAMPDALR